MADLRPVQAGDEAALAVLWHETFGDPEGLIREFWQLLPKMGFGLAAFSGGQLAGAAYMIEGIAGTGKEELPCAYLYAVAVDPAFRRQGLGASLSQGCAALARQRGARLLVTEPAEPSLFAWYDKIIGTTRRLCRKGRAIPAGAGPLPEAVSPEEYGSRREELLQNRPHMRPKDAALAFEKALCRAYGGDLYRVGEGIAAAYRENGACVIRELLGPEPEKGAAGLARYLGMERALLLEAAAEGENYLAYDGPALPPDFHWGISFD